MRRSAFSSGFPALVVSILLCWIHQPFDCLNVDQKSWALNPQYPAICDREYRLKYFKDRAHRKAIRAGILYVPYYETDTVDGQTGTLEMPHFEERSIIDDNYQSESLPMDRNLGPSAFSPIDRNLGPSAFSPIDRNVGSSAFMPVDHNAESAEFLPVDYNAESAEFLPTDFNDGSSEFIDHPSSEFFEFTFKEDRSLHANFARRRRFRPLGRNASELYGLKLQSRRNRLRKFVDETLRKLELNNAVLPIYQQRRSETADFCAEKSRYPESRGSKLRDSFKVDDVFERGEIRYPIPRRRKLRNSLKVYEIFGDRGIRSQKRRWQFEPKAKLDDRFITTKKALVSTLANRRHGKNSLGSSAAKIFWDEDVCKSRRIVSGRSVSTERELPYMAFVDTGCGGGIISDSWVLTAGHCVDRSVAPTYVHVGSIKLMTGCQYHVEEIFIHPNYTRKHLRSDIALLKIKPPFVFSRGVKALPMSTKKAVRNTCGVVAGWGAEEYNGALRIILSTTTIPIVSRRKCRRFGISQNQFCAGYDDASSDTCQGDSGGPLVVDGIIVGVVSYGYKCAVPKTPGVYVDVSFYRDWIRSITGF